MRTPAGNTDRPPPHCTNGFRADVAKIRVSKTDTAVRSPIMGWQDRWGVDTARDNAVMESFFSLPQKLFVEKRATRIHV